MLKENKEIFEDIKAHALERIDNCIGEYGDEIHHKLFNEDYFVIGYFNAENIAKRWDIDAFDLIRYNITEERDQFGEVHWIKEAEKEMNWEWQINLFVYWLGRDFLYEFSDYLDEYWDEYATKEQIEKLKKAIEEFQWEDL